MKLKSFRVREFQSIWDSNQIDIDDVTCFVGKNESGKTALLTALYRTQPIIPGDDIFDLNIDYPKREVEDYRIGVENEERQPTVVVETTYEMSADDAKEVTAVFGSGSLTSRRLTKSTSYDNATTFSIDFDTTAARKYLARKTKLPRQLQKQLAATPSWGAFSELLKEQETTEEINALDRLVTTILEKGATHHAYNSILKPRVPKFLYFDEYYQMTGRENINALIERKNNETLKRSDHPLLGLINLARLNLEQLLSLPDTQQLKNRLQGAGNHLTGRILKYWSQNSKRQVNNGLA